MVSKYNDALDEMRFSKSEKADLVEQLLSAAGADASRDSGGTGIGAGSATHASTGSAAHNGAPAAASAQFTAQAGAKLPRETHAARKPRRLRTVAAAAAAAVVLVAGSGIAYATGGLISLQQAFDDIFNGAPAKTEVMDKIGHPIDAVATSNGITVSADAVIGDASHYTVIFSIVRDDGEPFDTSGIIAADGRELLPYMFRSSQADVDGAGAYGATGSSYFYDADPSDPAIQMVQQMQFDAEHSLAGKTMRVDLRDLMRIDADPADAQTIPGTWHLKFELGYEDTSVYFPAGATFDLNGMTATIDSLAVSPIAFRVTYTVSPAMPNFNDPSGKMSAEHSAALDQYLGIDEVVFHLADSSTISQVGNRGGGVRPDGDVSHCETGFFFDQIIDVDQVVAITIGGTTITR